MVAKNQLKQSSYTQTHHNTSGYNDNSYDDTNATVLFHSIDCWKNARAFLELKVSDFFPASDSISAQNENINKNSVELELREAVAQTVERTNFFSSLRNSDAQLFACVATNTHTSVSSAAVAFDSAIKLGSQVTRNSTHCATQLQLNKQLANLQTSDGHKIFAVKLIAVHVNCK